MWGWQGITLGTVQDPAERIAKNSVDCVILAIIDDRRRQSPTVDGDRTLPIISAITVLHCLQSLFRFVYVLFRFVYGLFMFVHLAGGWGYFVVYGMLGVVCVVGV